jgi:integrase
MAVYKRRYPDGRLSQDWYVSWYVGGRQFKKKIGPNKRAATLFANDIELKRVRGELLGIREERKILFSDLAKKYLEWAKNRKAKHTVEDETSAITRFRVRFTGFASKITRDEVESYLSDRLNNDGLGPCRHNKELKFLRQILGKAVEWGYCRRNVTDGIRRLKEPPGRIRYLTEEERGALVAACSPRLRHLVEIALETGLRKGELLSLRWDNVDLRNRMIRVEHSKNGDRRDVPMTERAYEILQALPRRLDTPYLFATPDGKPQADLKKAWGNAVKRSGIQNFTFHDLRHTFASYLVMGGADLRSVQTLLGHKDITMTTRYAHLSPAHLREAISVLGHTTPRTKQDHAATAAPSPSSK